MKVQRKMDVSEKDLKERNNLTWGQTDCYSCVVCVQQRMSLIIQSYKD